MDQPRLALGWRRLIDARARLRALCATPFCQLIGAGAALPLAFGPAVLAETMKRHAHRLRADTQ